VALGHVTGNYEVA